MEDNLDTGQIVGPNKSDFYKDRGKKIQDIFIGIIGGVMYFALLWWVGVTFKEYIVGIFLIGFLFYFGAIAFFFLIRHRFIAIGLIILIFIPIIMFGGCLSFIGFNYP